MEPGSNRHTHVSQDSVTDGQRTVEPNMSLELKNKTWNYYYSGGNYLLFGVGII